MSIIHEALKKVQQGISPDAKAPAVETLPQSARPAVKKKIQSVFTNTCILLITLAVTIASIDYICQQFKTDIPKVQRLAQRSFYKLIRKKVPPPAVQELKPLAELTINSSPSAAPVTLNIHGIMANGTGNLALINDQVYQAGDEVDGAKILKIDLDSITVNINGTVKTIFVKD